MTVEIHPVLGIGDVSAGTDVAQLIIDSVGEISLQDEDIVVVTHKIVSKAEGRMVRIEGDENEFKLALIEREAASIVRRRGDLVIAETKHGFICANAGIDRSNTADGTMVLLPEDPDRSADRIRRRLEREYGTRLAVIISDTFGRPWRRGLTDVALGISGMAGVLDLKGTADWSGRSLEVTEVAVADELASAADLVMGKASGIPVAVIRGYRAPKGEGRGSDLVRPIHEELFR